MCILFPGNGFTKKRKQRNNNFTKNSFYEQISFQPIGREPSFVSPFLLVEIKLFIKKTIIFLAELLFCCFIVFKIRSLRIRVPFFSWLTLYLYLSALWPCSPLCTPARRSGAWSPPAWSGSSSPRVLLRLYHCPKNYSFIRVITSIKSRGSTWVGFDYKVYILPSKKSKKERVLFLQALLLYRVLFWFGWIPLSIRPPSEKIP